MSEETFPLAIMGLLIRQAREKKSMSRKDLVDTIISGANTAFEAISLSTLKKIECGLARSVSLEKLFIFSRYLDIEPIELVHLYYCFKDKNYAQISLAEGTFICLRPTLYNSFEWKYVYNLITITPYYPMIPNEGSHSFFSKRSPTLLALISSGNQKFSEKVYGIVKSNYNGSILGENSLDICFTNDLDKSSNVVFCMEKNGFPSLAEKLSIRYFGESIEKNYSNKDNLSSTSYFEKTYWEKHLKLEYQSIINSYCKKRESKTVIDLFHSGICIESGKSLRTIISRTCLLTEIPPERINPFFSFDSISNLSKTLIKDIKNIKEVECIFYDTHDVRYGNNNANSLGILLQDLSGLSSKLKGKKLFYNNPHSVGLQNKGYTVSSTSEFYEEETSFLSGGLEIDRQYIQESEEASRISGPFFEEEEL